MRNLQAKDLKPVVKILTKLNIKDILKEMFAGEMSNGELVSTLVNGIIESFPNAEKEIFEFVSTIDGRTPDEIAEMDIGEFVEIVVGLVSGTNIPFFKSAVKLT